MSCCGRSAGLSKCEQKAKEVQKEYITVIIACHLNVAKDATGITNSRRMLRTASHLVSGIEMSHTWLHAVCYKQNPKFDKKTGLGWTDAKT
jgi:hypothetical protein